GLEEMVDALQVLDWLPPMQRDRVLVVSNGGGMAVFLTDLCEKYNLNVPKPSQPLMDHLKTLFPTYYSFQNPIDLTGSGTNEQCALAVKHLLRSGEFDGLLMVLLSGTTGINSEIVPQLRQYLSLNGNIPIVIGAYGAKLLDPIRKELIKDKIPVFPSGETAARAMNLLVQYHKSHKKHGMEKIEEPSFVNICVPRGWSKKFDRTPDEMEIKKILQLSDIKVPLHHPIRSMEDIRQAINRLGFPMVLKVVGNEIKHKMELKGIKLNIQSEDQLLNEWMALFQTFKKGIWAEQQMPPGMDLIVGAHRDPHFGPVMIFGSGGQYVEIYKDVHRLLLPATESELSDLVYKTCAGRIIRGVRGEPPLNTKPLFTFLRLVSEWMIQEPNIKTLDFNPIRLYYKDMVVLDAKATFLSNLQRG
ncbi:MAG: acetate--CoA ligase family protein, partial [Nitrospinales bacterium]